MTTHYLCLDVCYRSVQGRFRLVKVQGHQRSKDDLPMQLYLKFQLESTPEIPLMFLKQQCVRIISIRYSIWPVILSSLRLQDCVVRVPYDTKVKRKTIQMAEKFQPVSSDLTLKERKEARSLRSVDLSDDEIGNRRNALAHCLVLVRDVPNRYYDS
ncbi:hypothetical protein GQR58_018836 [Nymphon striatum]|nr:hypothetical protein GQR58_018836 [Nymphon striatum]